MGFGFNPTTQEKYLFIGILIAGLVNGLLHVYLVPPWQHYDEPGQFEYSWLIANIPGLPEPNEFDQDMRRELAASMIEHDFFEGVSIRPNLVSVTEPIWIGISQTDDVPLYYTIVALPLSIFKYSDITYQLYLGRLVTLTLFLVTILGSYALTSELTEPGNTLRVLIPATVALIPAFVNIMTALNNDAGAAAFFTLFLWVSVRMMLRGISWKNLVLLILLAFACIFTKSTTIFVIPLAFFAVVYSLLLSFREMYTWGLIACVGLLTIFLMFSFDGAAFWHNQTSISSIQRVKMDQSPLGEHALRLDTPQGGGVSWVVQLLHNDVVKYIDDETITVGAWIWADKPTQARTPIVDNGVDKEFRRINVDTTPQFYLFSTQLPVQTNEILVRLELFRRVGEENVSIFYDGITLVEGDYSTKGLPIFEDEDGQIIKWEDKKFSNLIRNASFEIAAPRVRSGFEAFLETYLPTNLSLVISSIIDFEGYRNYYISSAQHLFRSFWAVFGWGHVYLTGSKPYRILLFITLIAFIGDVIYFWNKRNKLQVKIMAYLGLSLLGVWGMTLTRGVGSVFSNLFIPGARYATPVIVPTVMLFVVGWREVLNIIGRWLHIPKVYQYAAYISFLVVLNLVSLYSIVQFYGTM